MEYLRTDFQGMPLVIRDLDALDVPALVTYWHDSDPAYLHSIGVDLSKLTSREDTRQRFRAMASPPAAVSRNPAVSGPRNEAADQARE